MKYQLNLIFSCIIHFFLLCGLVDSLQAQQRSTHFFPQQYFRYPLPVQPASFSGNFGEIRGNHFHAGNDYRTQQRIGFPVFASADGYVSRIKTSAYGYGHGLYIAHPNGFTTVYGHLNSYAPKIEKINYAAQAAEASFEIDTLLSENQIIVKKGEIIGYSGNTGGSGGPHLHFEIRDSRTEDPINPQLFGLTVADDVPPYLSALYVYDLGNKPFSEQTHKRAFGLRKNGKDFVLTDNRILLVDANPGFGIVTHDASAGNIGRNGTYQVEMYVDNELKFISRTDRFSFANSRAVNSFMDYPAYIQSKLKIQKSFIEPNNPLNVYPDRSKNGHVILKDDSVHTVKYVACDTKGNISTLSFRIKRATVTQYSDNKIDKETLSYKKQHHIRKEGAEVLIPKEALYDDISFYLRSINTGEQSYSDTFEVYTKLMPLQKDIQLKISVKYLPDDLQDKALLVDEKGKAYGGKFEDGFVRIETKEFGFYRVDVDTLAPIVTPINISMGRNMQKERQIIFKIRDDLSGIASYHAEIDGKWVLMQFDAKTARLFHVFDEMVPSGLHQFELEVKDNKNNIRKFSTKFIK